MSSYKRERSTPGRSSMRGINRAQPSARSVKFHSSGNPDSSSHTYYPEQSIPSYVDEEDEDIYFAFDNSITKAGRNNRPSRENARTTPTLREEKTRRHDLYPQSAEKGLGKSGPPGSYGADMSEEVESLTTEEISYCDESEDATPVRALGSNKRLPNLEARSGAFNPNPSKTASGGWINSDGSESSFSSFSDGWDNDELYQSMGLYDILGEGGLGGNKNGIGRAHNTLRSHGTITGSIPEAKPRQSSTRPKAKSGKAPVKITSTRSLYIEKAPYVPEAQAPIPAKVDIEKMIAEIGPPALTEDELQEIEDMKAEIPDYSEYEEERRMAEETRLAPVESEYERELVEEMKAKTLAYDISRRKNSKKGSNPTVPEALKPASRFNKEVLGDLTMYRSRRVGAYFIVSMILIWLLHNTLVINRTFIPCPRHIVLSPRKTIYNIGSSVASIPKAMACSVFPCKAYKRQRLRTIDMLTTKLVTDYGSYKTYAASIDIFEKSSFLKRAAERLDPANANEYPGEPHDQSTENMIKQTREQYIKSNNTIQETIKFAKKICEFTSDTITGELEYLTSQVPRDLLFELRLPPRWNSNLEEIYNNDKPKTMMKRTNRNTNEIVKLFSTFMKRIDHLDREVDNAFRLTRILVDYDVPHAGYLIEDIREVLEVIKKLRAFTAWCINHFRVPRYDQRLLNDDSKEPRLESVEDAWQSILSFDSASIGRRRPEYIF